MKLIWLIALSLLMTACETSPPKIDFTFQNFEPVKSTAVYPEELPKLSPFKCYPGDLNGDGDDQDENECEIVGYDSIDKIDTFEIYKIRATSNTSIAESNANAANLLIEQNKELVSAGIAQENISKIREEQLQFERKERKIEKWYYRLMLLLVGAAGVYAAD